MAAKKGTGSGKGQARVYFAQQREVGERELILSAQVVRSLGTAPRAPAQSPAPDWREALRQSDSSAAPADATRVQRPRPSAPPPAVAPIPRGEVAAAHSASSTVTKRAWHADLALEQIPFGLAVGSSSHDMFEGKRDSFASLIELERAVASCTRCALYRGAKNPVPGEGDPNAGLMCVGEAPGATEDELGRPFVGQAGKLLTQILAAIDLPREKVYICNVLKHRPPNNRNPLPDEVTACTPYLVRQVELIRPTVILALGTFAAQTLLDTKSSMGKLREAIHQYHGIPCVVTYHPAALLRNPSWKRPTWEDVQLARRFLDRAVAQRGT
ncbi:MAG: uracil-DNA glycosylase [Gemmatimonadaceae bacterium]